MHPLVMLPAMGCDQRLYAPVLNLLPNHSAQTIIAGNASMAACVEQVLSDAPDRFIIFGTSFGGRVALETAIA
jgi:pimeloyl-ACP methyl ester carboxylesterase